MALERLGEKLKILNESPLVSVIVPNYNYSHYLKDCLDSILNQSYLNIEVILVDDGSADDSVSIAESFGEKVKVVVQNHQGVNVARNLGIKFATGTYIAFCDSDDVWTPEKIQLQVNFMESNQEFDLVYCGICVVDENLRFIKNQDPIHSGDCSREFLKHPSQAIVLLGASTALIRRSLIDETGMFDETMRGPGEDWDFFRRIAEHSMIDYIPSYLVLYRQHRNSASRVPSQNYFEGNRNAMRNLYQENRNVGLFDRRYSWIKLHWGFVKHELRNKRLYSALRQLVRAFSSIGI